MTKKQLLDKLVLILESEDANNTLTFETALEQYIRSKENILSPSTIRGYRILQRNAYDYINNLTLSKINELVLQKWANHNAIKYASKTINNQFGLITAVFKQNRIEIDTSSIRLKPKEPVNYIDLHLMRCTRLYHLFMEKILKYLYCLHYYSACDNQKFKL